MPIDVVVPLPVVAPLAIAAAMLALAHFLPRYLPDVIAIATALGVAGACAWMAVHTLEHGPVAYWFGGWTPRPGVVLGIGFGVDAVSAAIAAFIGLLFAASLLFSWGYFDEVHAHFHVLMLLFLAAMVGFCLTRDLFDLFVWFEVMSVVAFALTAYQLEAPSLAGALNFTVTNSLASFLMLAGVALAYGRAGVLDFEALGRAVAQAGGDPVVVGAFCVLAAALMIKGAILPFHFWLSDAHAVAPSPVSVIFSGAMVSLGVFMLAKLTGQVFAASIPARDLMRGLFLGLGCATAVAGGLMAWGQRHLKRMLAFSTVAHVGIMLTGLASLSAAGIAGLALYFVGHGLVKGALFMVVGMLLATRASLDELDLKGLGRGIWPAGVAMAVAGLLLGGAPWGLLDMATRLDHGAAEGVGGAWVTAAVLFGTALTGAAVLRAAGRVFLDLGPEPGEEVNAPSQADQEKADRPLSLMMIPCALLLGLAMLPGDLGRGPLPRAIAQFAPALAHETGALHPNSRALAWASVALAVGTAALALVGDRWPKGLRKGVRRVTRPVFHGLERLHSGLAGDYVLWIALGLASFSVAQALGGG